MIVKNYLKVTVRQLVKHPIYSLICVVGLAIGLAIGLIAMSYVIRESRWEDCHVNHDRIHRVEMQYHHADTSWSHARVMAPLGDALAAEIPGIDKAAVFRHNTEVSLKLDKNVYRAGNLIFARPEFFDVFTFSLKGAAPEVLLRPNTVLVSDSIAGVYFPEQNPIGKMITLRNQSRTEYELEIAGIIENMPKLTQLHCDFIASYATLGIDVSDPESWREGGRDLTYLLLDPAADPNAIQSQIAGVFSRHVPSDVAGRYSFSLKPFNDIYYDTYYSGNHGEIWPGFEYDVLFLVIGIGLFILIQAMVNLISLSTARAADRMKEVGVRKTFGATRSQLVSQFMGESIILTFASLFLGLAVFEFFRSGYQTVTPDKYELPNLYTEPLTIGLTLAFTLVVGILAGYYPAMYLSRIKPISILKGTHSSGRSRSLFRKSLVVFQFTLAIFFMIQTAGSYNQLSFLTGYELGFDRDNVMVMRFDGDDAAADCAVAKSAILSGANVTAAARGNGALGDKYYSRGFYTDPERKDTDFIYGKYFTVDYDFLPMYGIEIVRGRGFSEDHPEDVNHALLINEAMVEKLELADPIGYKLYGDTGTYEIVGVVKDFHGTTLDWSYSAVSIIALRPDDGTVLSVKLPSDDMGASIASVRSSWEKAFPDRVFDYSFLIDDIRAQYYELDSIMSFFAVLSVISIIISCLGTFGLALYTVRRKTKDVAIRKVLGASMSSVLKVLTKEFVYVVALANLIACPFAYLMLTWAFESYPFRASLGLGTYLGGGLLTILIVLATSAYHVTRATRANPIDALRYE